MSRSIDSDYYERLKREAFIIESFSLRNGGIEISKANSELSKRQIQRAISKSIRRTTAST